MEQLPKEKLKPQEKIDYINYIVKFLADKADHKKTIYFEFHSINLRNSPEFYHCNEQDFSPTSLKHSLLKHENDDDIKNLYEYIPKKNINDFFYDRTACIEVLKKEKFLDLKILLEECFNCINQNNFLASVIILRACLEMWLIKMGFDKNKLEDKIKNFIKDIEDKNSYPNLKEKINEIENLLNLYRLNGNNVAHCDISKAQKYIEDHSLSASLTLLCILIEETIFSKDIKEFKLSEKKNRINALDFETKKSKV